MKKIVLLSLVFIATFLNAQSVDPETFPLFSGDLKSKNLYTNTGGEGKVSIQSILDSVKIVDTISLNYNDFRTLILGSNLQTGMRYLLIDFQTIYDQPDFDASGNPKGSVVTKTAPTTEEIWVLALSSNQIADRAYSKTYPKDQIKYDWTYNVTEVMGASAKGRITERIDEWGNRTDYDHRTVLFKRYDNGSGIFDQYKDNGNASQEFLTFGNLYGSGALVYSNYIGDFSEYNSFYGIPFLLSNNIFNIQSFMLDNKTESLFYNNTFGDEIVSNTFGNDFSKNIFGNTIAMNVFYHDSNDNRVGNHFEQNTFTGKMDGSVVGDNTVGNSFRALAGSTIGNGFFYNICEISASNIGNSFQLNQINVTSCNIGNNMSSNFGDIKNFNWSTSVTDLDGIQNTNFNITDATGWTNFINPTNHAEFYTTYSKEVIMDSNFSYYSKYFNGTSEIYTIIN